MDIRAWDGLKFWPTNSFSQAKVSNVEWMFNLFSKIFTSLRFWESFTSQDGKMRPNQQAQINHRSMTLTGRMVVVGFLSRAPS